MPVTDCSRFASFDIQFGRRENHISIIRRGIGRRAKAQGDGRYVFSRTLTLLPVIHRERIYAAVTYGKIGKKNMTNNFISPLFPLPYWQYYGTAILTSVFFYVRSCFFFFFLRPRRIYFYLKSDKTILFRFSSDSKSYTTIKNTYKVICFSILHTHYKTI